MWTDFKNTEELIELSKNKTLIIEDEHKKIGQAYYENGNWILETFAETNYNIIFDKIIRYIIL